MGCRLLLAVRQAGDQEAEEIARDGPVRAVPGGARRGAFGGSAGLAGRKDRSTGPARSALLAAGLDMGPPCRKGRKRRLEWREVRTRPRWRIAASRSTPEETAVTSVSLPKALLRLLALADGLWGCESRAPALKRSTQCSSDQPGWHPPEALIPWRPGPGNVVAPARELSEEGDRSPRRLGATRTKSCYIVRFTDLGPRCRTHGFRSDNKTAVSAWRVGHAAWHRVADAILS